MPKAKASTKSQSKIKEKVEIEKNEIDQIIPEKVVEPKKRGQAKKEKTIQKSAIENGEEDKEQIEEPPQSKAAPKRKAAQKKPVVDYEDEDDEQSDEPKKPKITPKKTAAKLAKKSENDEEAVSPKEKNVTAKSTKAKAEKKPAQKKATKSTENDEDNEELPEKPQKTKAAPKRKPAQEKSSEINEEKSAEAQSTKKVKVAAKKTAKVTKKDSGKNEEEISDEITSPNKKVGSAEKKKLLNSIVSDYTIDFNIKENFRTKIVTWNVAGARSCLQKGLVEYLRHEDADIICLNEIKISSEKEIPKELKIPEYYHYFNVGKGNPGVAIFSKKKPISVTNDLPEKFTTANRLITAEYEDFYLVSCYVVNAGAGLKTLDKRLEWNQVFDKYVQELDKEKPVIIAGDLNVSHTEIDLANPKGNQNSAGFTKEERAGFTQLLSYGFIDTFRELYPKQEGAYTFWSYRFNARAKNAGWRLDYFVVSERFMENVVDHVIRTNIRGSDHCPIVLFLN